jgi:hypothetical protein
MKKFTLSGSFYFVTFIILTISFFSILQAQNVIQVTAGTNQIEAAFFQAVEGDTIELITSGGLYQEAKTVVNFFPLTVRAAEGLAEKPVWECGEGKNLKIKSDIWLFGIRMSGLFTDDEIDERDSTKYAIRTDDTISIDYKVICEDMDFGQFGYVFRADSATFASEIRFSNCTFTNLEYDAFRFRDYTTPPGQFGLFHVENCTAAEIRRYFLHADLYPSTEETAEIRVNHCTFYNIGLEQFYQAVIRVDDTADILMKNCLVNQTGRTISTSQATVQYCNMLNTGGFNIWGDAVIENNFSEDPEFVDPANFDFSVSSRFAHIAIGDDGQVVGDPRWAPEYLNIIYVPSDNYPTIQSGIDSAVHGDTVLVHTGTYIENVNYNGKNVLLGSRFILAGDENYIDQTVIDGNNSGSVVTFETGEDSTAILKGFVIQDGSTDNGGGIKCSASNPTMENLIIRENQAVNNGGGIYISDNSDPYLYNISLLDNTCTNDDGGGIAMINSNGNLTSVVISNNSVPSGVGGGIYLYNSSPDLVNCLISNNLSQGDGGGLVCNEGSHAQLVNVTITENFANDGGGGFACGNSSPVFLNSIISGNAGNWEQEVSIWDEYSEPVFNYCNTDMEEVGENNFYADPLFVDEDNGDFCLSNLSPCIGSGTSSGAPINDIEGNLRPYPPGSNPDMGAFENLLSEPWHATISTSPSSIDQLLFSTEIDSQKITIKNDGLADLEFNIMTNFVTVIDSQNLALSITDSGSHVNIANPDSFDLESDFTISAWVKTDDAGVIVAKSSGEDEPGPKTLFITNGSFGEEGTVVFDVGWVGGVNGKRVINDNIWHHIALTAEGSEDFLVRLYVDGTIDGEDYAAIAEYPTLGYDLKLGFDGREPHEFPAYHGDIDEVSIWNRALNQEEILSIMNQPPDESDSGLTGYWSMNEESGSICFDSSPNNNYGTFEGSLERSVSNVPYNPWMTCNPYSGIILPGDEMEVNVKLDATILTEIDYQANIVISSNDPYNSHVSIPVNLTIEPTGLEDHLSGKPRIFHLSQNYPNPFNPSTIIKYELTKMNEVELSIYNLLGQKVATLFFGRQNAGDYQVEWDASGFASGVYFYRLSTNSGYVQTKKLVVVR